MRKPTRIHIDLQCNSKVDRVTCQGHGRSPPCHLAVPCSITWLQNIFRSSLQFSAADTRVRRETHPASQPLHDTRASTFRPGYGFE